MDIEVKDAAPDGMTITYKTYVSTWQELKDFIDHVAKWENKEKKKNTVELFEIQLFMGTGKPIETIDRAVGRKEANEKFRKALENRQGKAIRMIQVVIDFASMEKKK